jgi:AraC-like DNA-binding protein
MKKTDPNRDWRHHETGCSPEDIRSNASQFNVFYIRHQNEEKFNCRSYNRKGLYKISLLKGQTKLFYADKTAEFNCALLFSNPNIPYSWEYLEQEQSSFFCCFTGSFFEQFVNIRDFPVFKPGDIPLFDLSPGQYEEFSLIFTQMQSELSSEFIYKYDSLRTMVLQLIYTALKLQPAIAKQYKDSNGSSRITSLFMELLERQFPVKSLVHRMELRHPVEFADHLSVHVNHLNYSLKTVTGRTTSQLIAERIMQEARGLLRHTEWNISEIAWSLGFEDLPHFIHFFKRNEVFSPKLFRKNQIIFGN